MTRTLRRPVPLLLAIAVLVGLLAALLPATSARAASPSPAWEQAQVGLTYSVYQPMSTLKMKQTSFKLYDCAPGLDEMIIAEYGKQGVSRWVEVIESQRGCEDGPAPVRQVATFPVMGSTARVFVDCPGSYSSCKRIGTAGLKKYGGYVEVVLPSGGNGLQSTMVEMYTARLSLAEIKTFTRGLTFVG